MREAKVTRKDKKANFKKLKKEYELSNYICFFCFFPREFKADWKKKKKVSMFPVFVSGYEDIYKDNILFKKRKKKQQTIDVLIQFFPISIPPPLREKASEVCCDEKTTFSPFVLLYQHF